MALGQILAFNFALLVAIASPGPYEDFEALREARIAEDVRIVDTRPVRGH